MADAHLRALERTDDLRALRDLRHLYRAGLLSPRVVGLLRVAGGDLAEELALRPVRLAPERMHRALPEREARLWAADCAERALSREREAGREPDARSWAAVEVARRYAVGEATGTDLSAAWAAARDAARDATGTAAWTAALAARTAAGTAAGTATRAAALNAWAAARDAARDAEREWQAERLGYWAGVAARRLAGD